MPSSENYCTLANVCVSLDTLFRVQVSACGLPTNKTDHASGLVCGLHMNLLHSLIELDCGRSALTMNNWISEVFCSFITYLRIWFPVFSSASGFSFLLCYLLAKDGVWLIWQTNANFLVPTNMGFLIFEVSKFASTGWLFREVWLFWTRAEKFNKWWARVGHSLATVEQYAIWKIELFSHWVKRRTQLPTPIMRNGCSRSEEGAVIFWIATSTLITFRELCGHSPCHNSWSFMWPDQRLGVWAREVWCVTSVNLWGRRRSSNIPTTPQLCLIGFLWES